MGRRSGIWIVGGCAALAVFASAADQAPWTAPASAIDAAQQDLQRLRTPSRADRAPALRVPELLMPAVKADEPAVPTLLRRQKPGAKTERELAREREKARNWLIEGFNAQQKRVEKLDTTERADGTDVRTDGLGGTAAGSRSAESDSPEPPPRRRAPADLAKSEPAVSVNPLDRFMADWMSPADFDLLAVLPAGRGIDSPRTSGAGASQLENFAPLGGVPGDSFGRSGRASTVTSPPELNPYLREIGTMSATIPAAPEVPILEPRNSIPVAPRNDPAAEVPEPRPNPVLTEQWGARDDARYFKQLKRF